jgi:hypothetical protein
MRDVSSLTTEAAREERVGEESRVMMSKPSKEEEAVGSLLILTFLPIWTFLPIFTPPVSNSGDLSPDSTDSTSPVNSNPSTSLLFAFPSLANSLAISNPSSFALY